MIFHPQKKEAGLLKGIARKIECWAAIAAYDFKHTRWGKELLQRIIGAVDMVFLILGLDFIFSAGLPWFSTLFLVSVVSLVFLYVFTESAKS